MYQPSPVDTSHVRLSLELSALTEDLAANTHDLWAEQRIRDGWRFGPRRDDDAKTHPCLVPYADLPEAEKIYDRTTAMETLKVILNLGYRIERCQPLPREGRT
jgi:hypothetical protein